MINLKLLEILIKRQAKSIKLLTEENGNLKAQLNNVKSDVDKNTASITDIQSKIGPKS